MHPYKDIDFAVLQAENRSLKEQIKELEEEIENLKKPTKTPWWKFWVGPPKPPKPPKPSPWHYTYSSAASMHKNYRCLKLFRTVGDTKETREAVQIPGDDTWYWKETGVPVSTTDGIMAGALTSAFTISMRSQNLRAIFGDKIDEFEEQEPVLN